jgi:ABC-type polar amino acid transport system ATPase subunit
MIFGKFMLLNPVALKIEYLSLDIGSTQILKNINLEINRAEIISVVGRSGSGKTSLLRCLNGLEIPQKGTVNIEGIDIDFSLLANSKNANKNGLNKIITEMRNNIGIVFQNFNLFPHLSVFDNISLAPKIVKQLSQTEIKHQTMELLEKVGLQDYANRKPHQLSVGQQQRVAIARALAMHPKIMLYDEPTSALDPEIISDIMSIIHTLQTEGITQIIVTHAIHIAKKISDKILFLDEGEVVEFATVKVLFENPQDARTKKYLNVLGG